MHDRELYRRILGIEAPWTVSDIDVDCPGGGVTVCIEHSGEGLGCPQCGTACPVYDTRQRKWRHLDTCQYATWLVAQVPRGSCPEHGVRQIPVPWADANSHLTALFEALVIDWLKVATIAEVARRLRLSWSVVAGVQERAVARGLARRTAAQPTATSIDEISFAKRHEYVTVVSSDDRVLQSPRRMSRSRRDELDRLRHANLKTARAWAIKEQAACLWLPQPGGCSPGLDALVPVAIRSRLEPIKRVARLVKNHLEGIITAVVTGATTARSEGFSAVIQKIKSDARGYRNRDRFRAGIYFHLGRLDLHSESLRA